MNLIAAAKGRNASNEIALILNEGMRALWRVAAWLAFGAALALIVVPWYRLLGLPAAQSVDSRYAVAAVLGTITLAIPLNLASRAQLGLGHGDRAFRWQALGQLLTLATVITCARAGAGLPLLAAAAIVTPLVSSLANTVDLYRSHMISSTKIERSSAIAHDIRHEGMLFFVLQLAGTLAFTSDLPLISALRGAADAGTYAIVQRLFSIIPLGLSLLWVPLWPSYRHALAARDHDWVLRTLKWTLSLAVLTAGLISLVLALGFDYIVQLWIRHPLTISGWMLAGFATWYVVDAAGAGIAIFLNAASIFRHQVIIATIFSVFCLGTKFVVIREYGIAAVPWATALTYIISCLVPTIILRRRLLTQALSKRI